MNFHAFGQFIQLFVDTTPQNLENMLKTYL